MNSHEVVRKKKKKAWGSGHWNDQKEKNMSEGRTKSVAESQKNHHRQEQHKNVGEKKQYTDSPTTNS